jgi:hypothetical protein
MHLGVYVGLPKAMPFDAVLSEFGVTRFYAPRGHVGERKAPITVGRSAANYVHAYIPGQYPKEARPMMNSLSYRVTYLLASLLNATRT